MTRSWIVVLCLGVYSCSGSRNAADQPHFVVEMYSFGGIAGGASGVSVSDDGVARLWTGRTADLRAVTDSIPIDRAQLDTIRTLASSDAVTSLRYDRSGDLTTVLGIRWGGRNQEITFAGGQVPDSFPEPAKELIRVLRSIHAK